MSQHPPEYVDEEFLEAMGMANLPPELRDKAFQATLYNLNDAVGKRIAEQLSLEQLDEFNKMTDGDYTKDQMVEWHKKNVPNFVEIIEEEAHKLRDKTHEAVEETLARYEERHK